MNEQDVTPITRNDKYAEIKLIADIIGMAGFIYYLSHPDVFERLGDKARGVWVKIVHHASVWAARNDIRSLPETDMMYPKVAPHHAPPDYGDPTDTVSGGN